MWKILVHSVVCLPVPQLEFIYLYLSKIAILCEFVVFLFVTKWLKGKKEKIGGFFFKILNSPYYDLLLESMSRCGEANFSLR